MIIFLVPSEPLNIQITPKDSGNVCVEWSPPAVPNGKITSYVILYTDKLDTSDDGWARVTKNGKLRYLSQKQRRKLLFVFSHILKDKMYGDSNT